MQLAVVWPGPITVANGEISGSIGAWSAVILISGTADLMPPDAPTGLIVTNQGDAQLSLAWNPVAGAAGYNLYRSPLGGGGWVKVNTAALTGTAFTDTGLENGETYFYVATALDSPGNESGYSNEASGLPRLTIGWANLQWPPTLDHTISAINRTGTVYGQVSLAWNPRTGAAGYNLYRNRVTGDYSIAEGNAAISLAPNRPFGVSHIGIIAALGFAAKTL